MRTNKQLQWAHAQMFYILKIGISNISIETLIRAAKFKQSVPTRSEDINKIQTAFPRSRTPTKFLFPPPKINPLLTK